MWSEVELGPWADSKQRFSPKIARQIEFDQKAGSMEWQQCLKRVDCPFMVITADQDYGSVLGDDEVSDLKKYLPDLQLVQIVGAGTKFTERNSRSIWMQLKNSSLLADWIAAVDID